MWDAERTGAAQNLRPALPPGCSRTLQVEPVLVLKLNLKLRCGMQDALGQHESRSLPPGWSETLQVEPVRKVLRTVVVGRGGAVEKAGNVIHLHFEGNWLPINVRPVLWLAPSAQAGVAAGWWGSSMCIEPG